MCTNCKLYIHAWMLAGVIQLHNMYNYYTYSNGTTELHRLFNAQQTCQPEGMILLS